MLGLRGSQIRVGGEREGDRVLEHTRPVRQVRRQAVGDVRDHKQLVDLRRERRQRVPELGGVPVRDDDCADLHESTSR